MVFKVEPGITKEGKLVWVASMPPDSPEVCSAVGNSIGRAIGNLVYHLGLHETMIPTEPAMLALKHFGRRIVKGVKIAKAVEGNEHVDWEVKYHTVTEEQL